MMNRTVRTALIVHLRRLDGASPAPDSGSMKNACQLPGFETRSARLATQPYTKVSAFLQPRRIKSRSEEHTSQLHSHLHLHSFPTRRSSDLERLPAARIRNPERQTGNATVYQGLGFSTTTPDQIGVRSRWRRRESTRKCDVETGICR